MNDERCVRDRVTAILEREKAAMEKVSRLCEGKERWRMSVPAEHTSDPDLVISASLADIPELARRLLEALDTIDKAKALHRAVDWDRSGYCWGCPPYTRWPCPTWQALNGGNESGDDR